MNDFTVTPTAVEIIKRTLANNAVVLKLPFAGLVVWDKSGFCRVYSTTQANFHFGVSGLDRKGTDFSLPFTLESTCREDDDATT